MKTDAKLVVETENLAVPEVHVEEEQPEEKKPGPCKTNKLRINYATAVPEINIGDK